jgi:hypothetical protein
VPCIVASLAKDCTFTGNGIVNVYYYDRPRLTVSDDGDESEAPRPAKRRRPSPSNSDPTSKRSQKRRLQRTSERRSRSPSKLDRSHTALPQTQPNLFVNFDDCAQSQHNSTRSLEDDEQMSTTAEYQEWPMRGFFKLITIGNEVRYGTEFSLEDVQQLCAAAFPLRTSSAGSNASFSARPSRRTQPFSACARAENVSFRPGFTE